MTFEPLESESRRAGRLLDPRQILGRYALLAVLDTAAKGSGFLATIALARHLGSAGFGAIGLAQSVTVYGLMAATCGLDLHAVRRAAARPGELAPTASTIVVLRLALSVLAYAATLGVALAVPQLREVFPLVALFGLTFFSGAVSLAWVAQATQSTSVYGLAQLGTQLLYLGIVLVGLRSGAGPWIAPVALVAGEATVAAVLAGWTTRAVGPLAGPWPLRRAWSLLSQAAPIGGAQVLRAVALGSDVVVIGLFLELSPVGWYNGAYKLYLVGVSLLAAYFVVLFPQLSRRAVESRAAFTRELGGSLARTLLLGLPALAVGALLARPVLGFLFDPTFEEATASLRILLVVLAVAIVAGHLRQSLIAMGRQGRDLRNVAASSVVHVGAKLALVPVFGIAGAAWGSLAGELVLAVLGAGALRASLREMPSGN